MIEKLKTFGPLKLVGPGQVPICPANNQALIMRYLNLRLQEKDRIFPTLVGHMSSFMNKLLLFCLDFGEKDNTFHINAGTSYQIQ